jgi:hypothetical protein
VYVSAEHIKGEKGTLHVSYLPIFTKELGTYL